MSGTTAQRVIDRYRDFESLAAAERQGHSYRIRVTHRPHSDVAIIAPHGGSIERRTSAIARALAGNEFNLYLFEGLDSNGSFDELHITSHRFDEPACLDLIGRCRTVLAVHGCAGKQKRLLVGGRDRVLARRIAAGLAGVRLPVLTDDHPYPGRHRNNICNRGRSGRGVQLEFTDGLRGSDEETAVVASVRRMLLTGRAQHDAPRVIAPQPTPAQIPAERPAG